MVYPPHNLGFDWPHLVDLRRGRYPEDLLVLTHWRDVLFLYKLIMLHDDVNIRLRATHFLILLAHHEIAAIQANLSQDAIERINDLILSSEIPALKKGLILFLGELASQNIYRDEISHHLVVLAQISTEDELTRYHALVVLAQISPVLVKRALGNKARCSHAPMLQPLYDYLAHCT